MKVIKRFVHFRRIANDADGSLSEEKKIHVRWNWPEVVLKKKATFPVCVSCKGGGPFTLTAYVRVCVCVDTCVQSNSACVFHHEGKNSTPHHRPPPSYLFPQSSDQTSNGRFAVVCVIACLARYVYVCVRVRVAVLLLLPSACVCVKTVVTCDEEEAEQAKKAKVKQNRERTMAAAAAENGMMEQ